MDIHWLAWGIAIAGLVLSIRQRLAWIRFVQDHPWAILWNDQT